MLPTSTNQLAALTRVAHEILTSSQTHELREAEQCRTDLDPWQLANLREMRRKFLHAAAVPPDLIEASSRATSKAEIVWREARRTSDFTRLLPYLGQVLSLRREVGGAKGLSRAPPHHP